MKAAVPNGITEAVSSGEHITPEGGVLVSMPRFATTLVCTHGHFLPLALTQTHFSLSWNVETAVPSYGESWSDSYASL